jgi:hypothetical protein
MRNFWQLSVIVSACMCYHSISQEEKQEEKEAQKPASRPAPAIRIQPLDEPGEGLWIELPGYREVGSPTFSPDGQWIAWDAHKDGFRNSRPEIWIARSDGTELQNLTAGSTPRWSADAQSLIFMRRKPAEADRTDGDPDIYTIDRDGTNEKRIGAGRWPDWSPDGKQIVFSRGGRPGPWGGTRTFSRVYIADRDGGNERMIADGDGPTWSPDGEKIACCQHDPALPRPLVRIIDLTTDRQKVIGVGWFRANWSGDSRFLIATGPLPTGQYGPVEISLDFPGKLKPIPTGFQSGIAPAYSADGKFLVFIARKPKE